MKTAKLFLNGQSQAVRLPKEYRFSGSEVGIRKVGEIILLFPKDDVWEAFLKAGPVSEDFGNTVLEARRDEYQSSREEL